MLLNEIVPCDPPLVSGPRPMPIDEQIMQLLSDRGPLRPADLAEATGGTVHRVHARLTALMKRSLVERRSLGERTRGPGVSVYAIARSLDE